MKVLTLKFGAETHEIHMLNVGDMFPDDFDMEKFNGFGGSRHPLIAGKDFGSGLPHKKPTASLVVRRIGPMGLEDKERDIHDPVFWAWVARMVKGEGPDEVIVHAPKEPDHG